MKYRDNMKNVCKLPSPQVFICNIQSKSPIQSTKKGTSKGKNTVDPTIREICSQPAVVVRRPMAADVDVEPGTDDVAEAPPEVEDPDMDVVVTDEVGAESILVPDITYPLPILLNVVQDEEDGTG